MIGYLLAHTKCATFEFNKTNLTTQELINKIQRDLSNDNSYSLYTFIMTPNDLNNNIAFINRQTNEGQDGKYSMCYYQDVFDHLVNNGAILRYNPPAGVDSMEWTPTYTPFMEHTQSTSSYMDWTSISAS